MKEGRLVKKTKGGSRDKEEVVVRSR